MENQELDLTLVNIAQKNYNDKVSEKEQIKNQKIVDLVVDSYQKKEVKVEKKSTENKIDQILANFRNNVSTEEDQQQVINYIEQARNHSCQQYEQEVQGEYYVSKTEEKKEKISDCVKTVFGLAVAATIIALSVHGLQQLDQAGRIRREVNKQGIATEINGHIYTRYNYSDDFREMIKSTSDEELVKEYKEVKDALTAEYREQHLLKEPNIDDIIEYMEKQSEELSKGKGK